MSEEFDKIIRQFEEIDNLISQIISEMEKKTKKTKFPIKIHNEHSEFKEEEDYGVVARYTETVIEDYIISLNEITIKCIKMHDNSIVDELNVTLRIPLKPRIEIERLSKDVTKYIIHCNAEGYWAFVSSNKRYKKEYVGAEIEILTNGHYYFSLRDTRGAYNSFDNYHSYCSDKVYDALMKVLKHYLRTK